MTVDTLIKNAVIVTGDGAHRPETGCVAINGGMIVAVGNNCGDIDARRVVDARGALLMPGAIDVHVHFREPGMTDKADIAGESLAAVAGGVTSFIDMPNTVPPTTSAEEIDRKRAIAAKGSAANYAFYIGATHDNLETLRQADRLPVAGIKLFVGSTTGNLLMDSDDDLDRLMAEAPTLIAVHAEDNTIITEARERLLARHGGDDLPVQLHADVRPRQACVTAARRVIGLARAHNARLHLAHVSTADELELLDDPSTPLADKLITSETCPQYLLFDRADYTTRGTRVKCNPAVKEATDRVALVKAVRDGVIDIIATDHAPHRPADKQGGALKAASGMPSIQFGYQLMMGLLGPELAAMTMARNPAVAYRIDRRGMIAPGYHADLVLVRPDVSDTISDADVISRCGWTPYAGMKLTHRVELTMVNGAIAYSRRDDLPADAGVRGSELTFSHARHS